VSGTCPARVLEGGWSRLHSLKGVGGGGFDLGERIFRIGKCFLEGWGNDLEGKEERMEWAVGFRGFWEDWFELLCLL
jgi:hypothetical protein